MNRYANTQPEWLRDWRTLYHAGVVRSAFPSFEWIAEWAGEDLPPSSPQALDVGPVPFAAEGGGAP